MRFGLLKYGVMLLLLVSCASIKQKKENLESFKELAYCKCVQANYSMIDSTFGSTYQDFSTSVIFMERSLSKEIWDSLSVYSSGKTFGAYQSASHTTSEYTGSNFISLSCLQFYKSKELDAYIKKLMKEDE